MERIRVISIESRLNFGNNTAIINVDSELAGTLVLTEGGTTVVSELAVQIARCRRCDHGSIVPDWLPVSYFGEYQSSNAWVLSINPSGREFVDQNDQPLAGARQRFRRLSDFEAGGRTQLCHSDVGDVLAHQDTYFTRPGVAYRPFFNRLGRFLSAVHDQSDTEDALLPFTNGVSSDTRDVYRYAHLDIVKCATSRPWNLLSGGEKQQLTANCSGYLEQQLRGQSGLRIVLINGRTAFEHCGRVLADRLGYKPTELTFNMEGVTSSVWKGRIRANTSDVGVVGWSPNVVNGHVSSSQMGKLVDVVRREVSEVSERG